MIQSLRTLFIGFSLLLFISNTVRATEGMWLISDIPQVEKAMHAMGMQIKAKDIFHPENPSITDAIVIFGGFCTGEIISNQGLILTNHHCGYDAIQKLSTLDDNILKNGFWAASFQEEIASPDLFVSFLVHIQEVSDSIIPVISQLEEQEEKTQQLAEIADRLIEAALADRKNATADVKSFYDGNRYYLLVYERYNDIRLVGTPPESIGKYGGDTDNWMWPRHTGDFALFRVYTDPEGNSADYSEENIPMSPNYWLPLSIEGVSPDDFAMILGYPGSTSRYNTSGGIELLMEVEHPNRIKLRTIKQEILSQSMEDCPDIHLRYASKFAWSSNYWKYSIGQSQSIRKHKIEDEKRDIEKEYLRWAANQGDAGLQYTQALHAINKAKQAKQEPLNVLQYVYETMYIGADIISFAMHAIPLYNALKEKDEASMASQVSALLPISERHWSYYDRGVDKKLTEAMLRIFKEDIEEAYHPSLYHQMKRRHRDDMESYTAYLFDESIFADSLRFANFLAKPSAKTLQRDPAIQAAMSFREVFMEMRAINDSLNHLIRDARRTYMQGLMLMHPDSNFYADANFTMRMTYGKVEGYEPSDAVFYHHATTHEGILEKHDNNQPAFFLQDDFVQVLQINSFGHYANKEGKLPVNFISSNDITGGNSGSPVINAKGHLIGLAFDGNWESMAGDITYMPQTQRCISVDIRYILFVIEQYGGLSRIIEEVDIIQ